MICTGRGSPYSMFVPALRAAALLPTAGAATKPCESALTRYSICAVGDAGSDEDDRDTGFRVLLAPRGWYLLNVSQ